MYFFNRFKKSKYTDFSAIGVDMHAHLIPGVDDGARNVEDSIQLMTGLKELGFTHLFTTPHTLQEFYPNTKETLQQAYAFLDGKIPAGMTLNLSSEYYLDEGFQQKLRENVLMPLPGNRLLFEFSQMMEPPNLEKMIANMVSMGYQPVLAHPERYLFLHHKFDYYLRLKEMGVELQLNTLSLTPFYGMSVHVTAKKLVEKELIDFIGTDLHFVEQLELLKLVPRKKHFERLVDSGLLKNKLFIESSGVHH